MQRPLEFLFRLPTDLRVRLFGFATSPTERPSSTFASHYDERPFSPWGLYCR